MHFEILVEDVSGKRALEILIQKIVGDQHTVRVKSYKGIGRIPRNLMPKTDANKRILLDQLPRLLGGYGKTFNGYSADRRAAVFVVCDLDKKCLSLFRRELLATLNKCNPKPDTYFCFAIEEGEAWFLGDMAAVRKAYGHANQHVLSSYTNDAICGTWECLADAVFSRGSQGLSRSGWQAIGAEKSAWSDSIAPHMNVDINKSPSFCYFRDKMRYVAQDTDATPQSAD